MTTIQDRFDDLGEQISRLRSRVFDLTNRLTRIVEHPDTPELIRQYAHGSIGPQFGKPIDGAGWAEAAFDEPEPWKCRIYASHFRGVEK